ncbi:hypothetical protein OBBRIDRAFT_884303 [Obba rivulosa]|uniref:DUF4211 domain-containing protein n=1 Tax=Obba rivulosa TaxID=1052685 RepID=A0A8E2DSM7_9APHY|nr:hypothetical protein OBBRIDRAFT_884303 [Obba rivulosa]
MARKKAAPETPKKLKQKTLHGFVASSSSPAAAGPSRSTATTRQRRRARAKTPPKRPTLKSDDEDEGSESSDVAAIRFEPTAIEVSDEERPLRTHLSQKRKSRQVRDDSEEQEMPASSEEEPEESPIVRKRASGKRKLTVSGSEEEDIQPKRRKLLKGVRPPSPDEEKSDLLDEIDEDKIIEPRFRTRNKKTAYQKNLEKIKRRKLGKKSLTPSSESDSEDTDEPAPFSHAKPHEKSSSNVSQSANDDGAADDSFIVEDDGAVAPELPAEFSMNTHQDLMHHFKIICQLFLHLAVQKAGDREAAMAELLQKEYFSVPLQVTRRKLDGLRDSLVASSVWRQDFKNSLARYPEFELTHLDYTVPGCDACHLGSRLSTLEGRLSGDPYDRTTFESLEGSEDSEAHGDDVNGAPKRVFSLGRFCGMRTKVFHKFMHWEYHLFEALSREVEDLHARVESRGFVRVSHAKGKRPPDDLSDADGIMEWLDDRGIIDLEWRNIKQMMDSARNLEMRAKKGEDEDDL